MTSKFKIRRRRCTKCEKVRKTPSLMKPYICGYCTRKEFPKPVYKNKVRPNKVWYGE